MITHTLKPNWGVNYDVGYIGFTSRTDDLVAAGIAWFERFQEVAGSGVEGRGAPTGIVVEHALVVTGPDQCVEAHAGTGVQKSTLSKYWNDPHCRLFFRKPRKWSKILGEDIAISAQRHIGEKYGYGLILADALANTYAGHVLNVWLRNWPNRLFCKLWDRAGTEVCSELAAKALQENVRNVGCLNQPARMIIPQELFEDPFIFEPWKSQRDVPTGKDTHV